jgi:hypothetical protein
VNCWWITTANLTAAAELVYPWNDNNRYLSWSQLGLTQQTDGLVSNAGIGQRWVAGKWLLGYNTFYDNLLDENLQRAGLGAEAWGKSAPVSELLSALCRLARAI